MEGHEYEGIRFMIECTMDKLKQTIKVDISTGDVRAEANTKMRDFYDIHVLLEQDVVTIDRDTMKSTFYATCKRRKSTERIVMIDDVINKIADDEVIKQQWKNYRKNNYYVGTLE